MQAGVQIVLITAAPGVHAARGGYMIAARNPTRN